MSVPPRAIVFDIGNVLIAWNPGRLYNHLIPDPEERAAFRSAVDLRAMNLALDRGAPFKATVAAMAARHPNFAHYIMAFHDRWIEMASPAIPGSVTILEAVKASGFPVFALSNFGVESFAHAQTVYPFLTRFDRCFISGELGILKPDAAIYRAVETETGFAADALFFTDDKAENVEAAAARGWRTHQFRDPQGLATALRAEGVMLEGVSL